MTENQIADILRQIRACAFGGRECFESDTTDKQARLAIIERICNDALERLEKADG